MHAMRPRFEWRFSQYPWPSDDFMTLVFEGVPDDEQSTNFAHVRSRLVGLVGFPRSDQVGVQLRFHFTFFGQSATDREAAHAQSERRIAAGRHYGGTLRGLKRVLVLAKQFAAASPRCEGSTKMQVVAFGICMLGVYVPDDAREWLRLIASHVPIFSLTYGVSSRAQGIGNFYGPFLWRLLAPHVSRRLHLGLQNLSIHANGVRGPSQIIAMCSAIAQSETLQYFSFTDNGGVEVSEEDSRVWASWLAFALFSHVSRHSIRTVHLNLKDRVTLYATAMAKVLEHPNPVAYLAALFDGIAEPEAAATKWPCRTVRLRADATIHGSDLPADSSATTVYHGQRAAECHVTGISYGNFTRILIPGVGFGCVKSQDVETTKPTHQTGTHAVRSFSLCVGNMDNAALETIFRLVGAPLTTVSLRTTGKWDRVSSLDVESLLMPCPRLKRVSLVSVVIQLRALTAARWGRKLESLTLRSCRVLGPKKKVRVQVDTAPSLSVFPQLSSLFVCTSVYRHAPELQDFVLALDAERDLERFEVITKNTALQDRYNSHTKKRDGHAIPGLGPRHKRAFLSVVAVPAGGAATRGCQLDPDTITHIFELAARSTHDRISTAR